MQDEKFLIIKPKAFRAWLNKQTIKRTIKCVQMHHTYIPGYKHFKSDNYVALCNSMERSHLERGFSEIGQNISIFPDGMIVICRPLDKIPAGIKGANVNGVCIENIGCFDKGKDEMTEEQRNSIILVTRALLAKFKLEPTVNSVIYHHWYDLVTGKRIPAGKTGNTKSCPGTNFFGGNTIDDCILNFLPLLHPKKRTTKKLYTVKNGTK